MFKDIPGTNGFYRISLGDKIRCISYHNGKWGKGPGHTLKNRVQKNGYIFWYLSFNGKRHNAQAAYWIALTFPELVQNDYFDGAEIDHIDTNTLNNHPSNLRWVDSVGQNNNELTKQHRAAALKGKCLNHPSLSKPVNQYSLDGQFIAHYESTQDAHRKTNINQSNISACCRGERKTAGGYVWAY